jgi:two-component system, NarL family, nitrate/nitrite response regulator NarL
MQTTGTSVRQIKLSQGSGRTVPTLQSLIRTIVAQTDGQSTIKPSNGNNETSTDEIIVDAEVDGVRYLLVRSHKPITSSVSFSPREREVARMVAKGYPNKTIADVLEISPWTVCTHLRRIFAKLRVSSRAAMVARLINDGIVKDFT